MAQTIIIKTFFFFARIKPFLIAMWENV
jgi:hypothetical protein